MWFLKLGYKCTLGKLHEKQKRFNSHVSWKSHNLIKKRLFDPSVVLSDSVNYLAFYHKLHEISLFKVMLHGTIFNDNFLMQHSMWTIFNAKIIATIYFMVLNSLLKPCNTLPQQIVAFKIVCVLRCIKNRLLKIDSPLRCICKIFWLHFFQKIQSFLKVLCPWSSHLRNYQNSQIHLGEAPSQLQSYEQKLESWRRSCEFRLQVPNLVTVFGNITVNFVT